MWWLNGASYSLSNVLTGIEESYTGNLLTLILTCDLFFNVILAHQYTFNAFGLFKVILSHQYFQRILVAQR